MLLALWPLLLPRNNAHSGGTLIDPDITHRAIRGKVIIERTAAMVAAEAHLQRLQEVGDGTVVARNADEQMAGGSTPSGDQSIGNVAVRIPRYEHTSFRTVPEELRASPSASDAISHAKLDAAMKAYAARQAADEDDEMAMVIILAGM